MSKFEINGIEYTFETDSVNNVPVLAVTYTQNGESFTIWTSDTASLPESQEEAAEMFESLYWAVEQSDALDNNK